MFSPRILTLALSLFALISLSVNAQQTEDKSNHRSNKIEWVELAKMDELPADSIIFARGTIVSVAPPRPDSRQPYTLYLTDKSGTAKAILFQPTYNDLPDQDIIEKGQRVDVYVKLNDYKGQRQLVIREPKHIRRTPGSSAAGLGGFGVDSDTYFPITIGAINMTTIGHPVQVRGTVEEIIEPPNERTPWKIVVKDTTGKIMVIYWDEVYDAIDQPNKPEVGKMIQYSGVVNEYRGELQLRIDDANNVTRQFDAK